MSTVDNLRSLGGDQPLKRVALFTVQGITRDLSEVIVDDGTAYITVPCLDSYRRRHTGDRVLALQLDGNDWVIVGKLSADESPIVGIAQGTGDPSGGYWRAAATTWVFDQLDGRRSLYFDMTGAPPEPVIVEATDAITWTGSTPSRELIGVDGTASVAVWYYDGAIAAACVGETPTAMFLQITRSEEGGPDRLAPLRLGMHSGLIATPTVLNIWDTGVMLAKGQAVSVPVPDIYLSVLADGTVGGFAALAEATDSTMRFEPDADLHIHFG